MASFRVSRVGSALLLGPLLLCTMVPTEGQANRPVGRDAAMGLRFGKLSFDPPEVQRRTLESGVAVFLSEDHSLPLVTLYARFQGGYAVLPRSFYAAASALPGLLRTGGTTVLPPDSVDYLLDFYALQMTFGGGGQSTYSSVNTLTKHLAPAIGLWSDILLNPGFDSREVGVWRDRQLESIRRRADNPGLLAVSEFNRIMFGDHPIGWELSEEDLNPERMNGNRPSLGGDGFEFAYLHGTTRETGASPVEGRQKSLPDPKRPYAKHCGHCWAGRNLPGDGSRLLCIQDRELHPRCQRIQQPALVPGPNRKGVRIFCVISLDHAVPK